jgi:hypothetical protein
MPAPTRTLEYQSAAFKWSRADVIIYLRKRKTQIPLHIA